MVLDLLLVMTMSHSSKLNSKYKQQMGLQLIVERFFVERLFTNGQLVKGYYVETTLHEVNKILHC